MAEYRQWIDPLLREENDKAAANSRQKLHASLALLPVDATQVDYLYGRLLDAEPHEVPVIRDALAPHKDELLDKLWAVVENAGEGQGIATAASGGGAGEVRPGEREVGEGERAWWSTTWCWKTRCSWACGARRSGPSRSRLLAPLADIFRDRQPERAAERTLATNLLADYAADQPQVLADLLMDADEKQFAVIYPKFKEQGEQGLPLLIGEIDKKLPAGPALLGRQAGKAGEAAGECGGGPA